MRQQLLFLKFGTNLIIFFFMVLLPNSRVSFCNEINEVGTIHQSKYWSVRMAESIMSRRSGVYGERWNYVTGTVLKSFEELWRRTADDRYFQYIQSTVDAVVQSDGSIKKYKLSDYNIDMINEGRILLLLYKETNEDKYKKAADLIRSQLKTHPRTSEGGFWHKKRYPHQMWLDGLYMGSSFYSEYGKLFNEPENFDDVVKQITLIETHTRDSVTGLLYHGWDESNEQEWADPVTGCSPSFWGRAMGWYAMALVDVLDYLPADHPGRNDVVSIMQRLAEAVSNYQDKETGVWYQIVDQGNREGNYLEASVSCMFAYALAKAVRFGYIDKKYLTVAQTAYAGILQEFIKENDDGTIDLTQICSTAGLGYGRDGSFEYYVYEESRSTNDGKGTGPFILASLEMELSGYLFPPSDLEAVHDAVLHVALSWTDNSENENGFIIERSEGNDFFIELAVVVQNDTNHLDTLIEPLKEYSYRVRAYSGDDTSHNSNVVKIVTMGADGSPSYPIDPFPPDQSIDVDETVQLSWTPANNASSYDVYLGEKNPPDFKVNQAETIYYPDILESSTTYYWRIDVLNEIGKTKGRVWSFTTKETFIKKK